MGSSANPRASAAFLTAFREQADATGVMRFADFMALALYHPAVGYYRQPRQRIGRTPETDFFTASTSGPLFGELITAAACTLLGAADARNFEFVEIGAEPHGGILQNITHPFRRSRTLRIGQPLTLEGNLIVFSNELFDAQPFHRFIRREGRWQELAVALDGDILREITRPGEIPAELPGNAPEGYVIDAPFAARDLMTQIAAQPWHGLIIACDYGKTWTELTTACPAGTARTYHRHQQGNDLLAQPGDQDLTCHICWDWLANALTRSGFTAPKVQSQEAFFVHHATSFLQTSITDEAGQFSPRKQALAQLLHPAHLGQKFQVLHAWRQG